MGHVPSTALQLVINNPRSLVHVYELDTELGKGAFGTVRLGCIRATGAKRAIKTISSLSRRFTEAVFLLSSLYGIKRGKCKYKRTSPNVFGGIVKRLLSFALERPCANAWGRLFVLFATKQFYGTEAERR